MPPAAALVLFDIDGTLVRKAGPHHRLALERAALRVTGIAATTRDVALAGMLDRDIVAAMLRNAGARPAAIRAAMPAIVETAGHIYARSCPDLRREVCPGVRALLGGLARRGAVLGLVTGNLARIGWKKLDRAGLKRFFRFGAFAELASDRAGLVRLAIRAARREGWIARGARVSLIGDHLNDIRAAQANGVQSIAVATGLLGADELGALSPDLIVHDLRALRIARLL